VAYGINFGGDALQSLARMDLQQQHHTLSSIRTLFLTQLWMNPTENTLWVHQPQTTKQASNGWGRG